MSQGLRLLACGTGLDIVVYPIGYPFPIEISCDNFQGFFLSEMSCYLRIMTTFSDKGLQIVVIGDE